MKLLLTSLLPSLPPTPLWTPLLKQSTLIRLQLLLPPKVISPDPPEDEDYEDSEGEPSYDPHNPSAGLDDGHSDFSDDPTPSGSTDVPIYAPPDPSPSDPDSEFYFWPDDVEFYREFARYRGHEIPYHSGDIYVTIHDGAHVFSPLSSTPAVQALVYGSSRVVAKPDLPDSRQEHFKALAKIVNTGGYRKFHLDTSSSTTSHSTPDRFPASWGP